MGNSSSFLAAARKNLNRKGKISLDEYVASCEGMTDDEKNEAVRAKIDELLASNSLPPVLLINFKTFIEIGEFPRCPDHLSKTRTLDSINRDESLILFISHGWLRAQSDADGADGQNGKAHPDNAAGDKFKLCVEGIEWVKRHMAYGQKECYLWFDYGCLNQDNNPALELEQLDKIMECCDAVFTPVVDLEQDWELPTATTNMFRDYRAKLWNNGSAAYLNRAWCRLEMFYAANVPIVEAEGSAVQRYTRFTGGLAHACKMGRRPHLLFGHQELNRRTGPIILPPLQNTYFDSYHPLKGSYSVPADEPVIESLIEDLRPYMEQCNAQVGYEGERNEAGQKHGRGVEKYPGGDVYEGAWANDLKSGAGVLRYADGSVYEGDFCEGRKEGKGVYRFPDGDEYTGDFKNDEMCGVGTLKHKNGDVYEGDWKNCCMDGEGTLRYVHGAVYQGQWKLGEMHGLGSFRSSKGEERSGEWKKGSFLSIGLSRSESRDDRK